jgi:hypothetical protein
MTTPEDNKGHEFLGHVNDTKFPWMAFWDFLFLPSGKSVAESESELQKALALIFNMK